MQMSYKRPQLSRTGTTRLGSPQGLGNSPVGVSFARRTKVDLDHFYRTMCSYQVRGMVRSQYMAWGTKAQKAGRDIWRPAKQGNSQLVRPDQSLGNPCKPHEEVTSWSHEAARPAGSRGVGPPRPVVVSCRVLTCFAWTYRLIITGRAVSVPSHLSRTRNAPGRNELTPWRLWAISLHGG